MAVKERMSFHPFKELDSFEKSTYSTLYNSHFSNLDLQRIMKIFLLFAAITAATPLVIIVEEENVSKHGKDLLLRSTPRLVLRIL